MVLKLHAHPMSAFAQKVMIVLAETKTPYELVLVDMQALGQKEPEYLAKNPFGTVPCMDDDGFVLFESSAISQYIAAKANSPLVTRGDLQQAARFEQALSIERSSFDCNIYAILRERVFLPLMGRPKETPRADACEKTLAAKVAVYDQILAKQRYLAGDELTLADLNHLPFGSYVTPHGYTWFTPDGEFPHLARWWADISSRPSWAEVQRIARESTPLYGLSLKPRTA